MTYYIQKADFSGLRVSGSINRLNQRGMLNHQTIVSTIMSNSALPVSLEKMGIHLVQTAVGDRHVYEQMQEKDYMLGGEQSGHIILKKYATTGDGLLTAIMLTEELCDTKQTLSKLRQGLVLYPQLVRNVRVRSKEAVLEDKTVQTEVQRIEKEINGKGRVLLRKSGTEPVIRIMVECEKEEQCETYVRKLEDCICQGGHCE